MTPRSKRTRDARAKKREAETTLAASMREAGDSFGTIFRATGVPRSTIQHRVARIGKPPAKIGRKAKLSPEQRDMVREWATEHKRASIPDLQAMIKDTFQGLQVATRTLYSVLKERPSWVPLVLFFHDDESRPAAKATLLKLIKSARKSIDVCTFIFSSEELCQALIDLSNAGVTVRVLVDGTEGEKADSKVSALREANASVRLGPRDEPIGSNFAIIDKNCRLTGSMDWSDEGLNSNTENVEIFYRHEYENRHKAFSNLFEEMWGENAARSR